MIYHPTDTFLQSFFPVLPVPKLGQFQELNQDGHRYLVADDGLWIEVRTPWLYFRQKIGDSYGVPIPYGKITSELRFTCPSIPRQLLADFVQASREASPNEIAGQIIWNRLTNKFRLQILDFTSNGPAHIDYLTPEYSEGEMMVVDLHSHGRFDAGFSRKDDMDDLVAIKIAGVVGRCGEMGERMSMRLCVLGMYCNLPDPLEETMERNHGT